MHDVRQRNRAQFIKSRLDNPKIKWIFRVQNCTLAPCVSRNREGVVSEVKIFFSRNRNNMEQRQILEHVSASQTRLLQVKWEFTLPKYSTKIYISSTLPVSVPGMSSRTKSNKKMHRILLLQNRSRRLIQQHQRDYCQWMLTEFSKHWV